MAFQPRLVLGGLSPNLPTRQPALSASTSACKSVSATSQAKVKKSGDKKSGQRYIASADLSSEYAPLKKRGSNDREYTREEEDSLRKAGAKNIDLWLTPTLYPTDPGTGHLPPVSSIPNLLRWLCEGGLAAYSWALLQAGQQGVAAAQARAQEELGLKATRLQLESDKARREAQAAINQAHGERLLAEQRLQQAEEENERKLREIAKHAACAAATHAEELAKMKQEFAALEREMEASLAHRVSEKEHEMRALLDEKIEELEGLQLVERMLRAEQQKLEQQLNKARQTGGKLRNRVGKDYSDLKKGGGAEKKRRREAL